MDERPAGATRTSGARLPWLERRWAFPEPVGLHPSVLARLRGTPARLEEAVAGLDRARLTRRPADGSWSIQSNVGHLARLEELPAARLADFLAGAETLSPWSGNDVDDDARYDEREIGELLRAFRAARERLLARLDALAPADFARTARHPRLDAPMRLVDMCRFQAEHDDHHLARIHELARD